MSRTLKKQQRVKKTPIGETKEGKEKQERALTNKQKIRNIIYTYIIWLYVHLYKIKVLRKSKIVPSPYNNNHCFFQKNIHI